jgi:Putative peptidoglycan binding domain
MDLVMGLAPRDGDGARNAVAAHGFSYGWRNETAEHEWNDSRAGAGAGNEGEGSKENREMMRRKLLLSTAALLVGVGFASAQGMREGTHGGGAGAAAGGAQSHMSQGAAGAERGGGAAERSEHAQGPSRGGGAAERSEHAQGPSRSEQGAQRSEHAQGASRGEGAAQRNERAQGPNRSETTGQGSSQAQSPGRNESMSQRSGKENKAERRSSEGQKQGEAKQNQSTQREQNKQEKRSTTGQAPSNEPSRRGEAQHQDKSTSGQAPANAQPSQRGQNEQRQNRSTTGQAPSNGTPSNGAQSTQRNGQQAPTAQQPATEQQGRTNLPAQNQTQTGAAREGTSDTSFRSATGRVTLDRQRETTIRETVLSRRDAPRVSRVDFALNVGVVVPTHVHAVPITRYRELVEVFPEYRSDEFFVVDDDIVVMDHSRHVVDVVPAGPRSHYAHAAPRSSGTAVAIELTPVEIREVQEVLIQEGFLVGEPTGVLDARTHDAIIAFQRQKGIQVTGSIDERTVSSLGLSDRIGQGRNGGSAGAATTGQGSAGEREPDRNMNGQRMPSTNGQGQSTPQQPTQPNMRNQGANQPNGQMPRQDRSTTGQAPSGGMQQQAPAQSQPMQNQPGQNQPLHNQPMSGQGGGQSGTSAPQHEGRPSR